MSNNHVLAPISMGELLDKIVILEIKSERMKHEDKLANVKRELESLRTIRPRAVDESQQMQAWEKTLRAANEELWDLEDRIRDKERLGDFGPEFIEIARSIYRSNDKRAHAKKEINLLSGSTIVEEKSYAPY